MKYFALLLLLCCSFTTFAQKRDTSYYYTDRNRQPVDKDKAIYVFKLYQVDSGWVFTTNNSVDLRLQLETYADSLLAERSGPYIEYYGNGKVSLSGMFKANKRNGVFKTFDRDGHLQKVATYHLDSIKGKSFEYYPNGKVKEEKVYEKSEWPVSKTTYFGDGITSEKVTYDEKGKMLTSMQYYPNGKLGINERFNKNGKVIEGTYFDQDGNPVKPYKMEIPATYPGGIEKFYTYLERNIKYPKDAIGSGIKGHVLMSFTITETGSLEDIKVDRGLSPSLDEEAIRVVKGSPNWIPAKQYGKPVRVKYNIPIKFSANY